MLTIYLLYYRQVDFIVQYANYIHWMQTQQRTYDEVSSSSFQTNNNNTVTTVTTMSQ
jgi:hypothetical protein